LESFGNDLKTSEISAAYADEYYNDIWVYRVKGGAIDTEAPIAYAYGVNDSYVEMLENKFEFLMEKTQKNGGVYIAMLSLSGLGEKNFDSKIIQDNIDRPEQYPIVASGVSKMCAVHCNLYQKNGESFFVVQRANISPIITMVQTLENQILFLGTVLIVFALLLAVIMAKLITTPITDINESAKRLAAGKYNTEFSGHGYREIEELSETLNFAAKELSRNDVLQKELISNVSHDLRTPLTMIKGYGEVMRDIPGENTPENLQVIIDETARLTDLVNDMLDLSKIQAGSRVPQRTEFCLTEVVRNTLYRYEKLTMQEGYKIDFLAEENINVVADNGMILQVVYNLINNAINYTGSDKYVEVKQMRINDRVRISVRDTGEGIDEKDLPYIWDRYYKVDKVHKRATVGTGLGLSIVKGILELHGAKYGVDSAKGKGSTFWFEIKTADSYEYKAELVDL
jgi:signal transduction histidine kinase